MSGGKPTKKPEPTEVGKPPTHTPHSDPQANPRPTGSQPTVISAGSVPQTTAPIADTPQTTTPIAQITTVTQTVAATSPTMSNAGFPLDPIAVERRHCYTICSYSDSGAEQIAGPVLIPQTKSGPSCRTTGSSARQRIGRARSALHLRRTSSNQCPGYFIPDFYD